VRLLVPGRPARLRPPWTLRCPEYRGNGVLASLGNLLENPHVGMVFLDFDGERVGLHVNGTRPGRRGRRGQRRAAAGGDYFGSSCEARPWVAE
jgi:hypothetical protein